MVKVPSSPEGFQSASEAMSTVVPGKMFDRENEPDSSGDDLQTEPSMSPRQTYHFFARFVLVPSPWFSTVISNVTGSQDELHESLVGDTVHKMATSPLSAAPDKGRLAIPAKDAKRSNSTIERLPVFWPLVPCVRFDINPCLAWGLQRLIAPEGGKDREFHFLLPLHAATS